MPLLPRFTASCACGTVLLEALGSPIDAVACHCKDCRAAAGRMEALPDAPRILDAGGGTPFLVFRQDRMRVVQGAERLRPFKLAAGSPTSRYLTTCCNTMLYVGFDDAKHWVSMHRDRFQGDVPALRMRVCTGSMPNETMPAGLPRHRGYPPSLIGRLLLAGMARWIEGRPSR